MDATSRNRRRRGVMRTPNHKVLRCLRVMHGMLHIKGSHTRGTDRNRSSDNSQGKNARQSHPGTIPLSNGLRAMRPYQRTSF
jgi:hypothetical protein